MKDVDNRVDYALKMAEKIKMIVPLQPVVCVTGRQPGAGFTNVIRTIIYKE